MALCINSSAVDIFSVSGKAWQAVADAVSEPVCLVAADGHILFANKRLVDLIGGTNLCGLHCADLFQAAPDELQFLDAFGYAPVARENMRPLRLRAVQSLPVWVRLSRQWPTAIPGLPPGPSLVTLTNISTEILQLQRQETLLSAADLGTWEWNIQAGTVVFNERWASMAGYTLRELHPLSINTWVALLHPDDLPRSNLALDRHFHRQTQTYECECRLLHKDGHWQWILTRGRVTSWGPDGQPRIMCGTHQDIAVQKRVYDTLLESERSYELAALGSPSAFYDWDIESDAIAWRGRSYEVMGMTGNQDLPTHSTDFQGWVHPEDHAQYRATMRHYFSRESEALRGEMRLIQPCGRIKWVEYHGAALWNETGRAIRMFGSFTDIDMRKQTERALETAEKKLAAAGLS